MRAATPSRRSWPMLLTLAVLLAAARAVSAAAPAPSAADAEVQRVIGRYVEVTGGAAAAAAEASLYTHGTVEAFGFKGTMDTWAAPPARHYSRVELGPFKLSDGSDGAIAWRTDPTTGRIVRLTDRDSLEALESTWFELERWTQPGFGGGTVTVSSHEHDSTGTWTVLAIQAPGAARPHRLWFSEATGWVDREESQHDQSVITTRFADWKPQAGRVRACTTRVGLANMPANEMVTHADSFAVNVDVAQVPFAPPDATPGANAPRWLGASGEAKLPFDYRARHVWLKVSVNGGPPEDFLFDTGATITVLDSTYAAAHGLAGKGFMQAAGAGAAGSASFATLGTLAVKSADGGGVELRDLKVAVMNVSPAFAHVFWGDLAGVLGYDFISRFVVTLDYDAHTLVLHDPHTFVYDGHEAPLPMKLNGVVPSLVATLDGRDTGEFRLDVGSSSTVDIHAPFARSHGIEKRLKEAHEVTGAGFGGQFTTVLGRLKRMTIGPYAWNDPMVSVSRATEGAFASEDFAGNIGNRILERFRVTLDYEHRRVWLEPGRRYADRDAFTRTGLMLGWWPDHVEALSVLRGSPAEKAGVREGDRVSAVDGKAAGAWALPDLDALFDDGPDGRKVTVTVNRDGHDVPLTMTLREMMR